MHAASWTGGGFSCSWPSSNRNSGLPTRRRLPGTVRCSRRPRPLRETAKALVPDTGALEVALRAVVVGGGLGGMAAAVALARAGIDVQVHEQAQRRTVGGVGCG